MIAAGKPTVHPSEFDPMRYPPAVLPQSTPRSAVFATPPPTAASLGGRSTATMRSNATDTTSRKRSAKEMGDEEHLSPPRRHRIPDSFVVERASIRSEVQSPYIFISDRTLQVRASDMEEMREMIMQRGYHLTHIRADPTGYYWIFRDYYEAERCLDRFQDFKFHGVPLDLTLETGSAERGREVSSVWRERR